MLVATVFSPRGAAAPNTPNTPATSILEANAAAAVHRRLAAEASSGVRLLGASLSGQRLTLNFSRDLLNLVPGTLAFEAFAANANRAAGDVLREELGSFEIFTEIEGMPLSQFFPLEDRPAAPPVARRAAPLSPGIFPVAGALAGRRIALSPGHGYYLLSGTNYVLQRSYFSGIVEDFVNHDIITHLNTLLVEAGADVRPTRNLDRATGLGETGFPRWQEAARYHVKSLGADASVWNESGFTHLEQDIRCRPRYANSVGAELLVSVHNNGGGGTGTETLYDTNNGYGPESKRLADILHAKVIAAIRRDYNPAWTDRRVQGFNGSYGENRLATRPAVLMEIAFMDRPTPDNAALRDERFKLLVATAIRDGIREFLEGPAPAAPTALIATGDATGITLSWVDTSDNETGFRVERKTGALGTWSELASVGANTTTYRDPLGAANAGIGFVYRVRAFNATSSSDIFSNEATAATPAPPPTTLLISVTPAPTRSSDWGQEVEFTVTITDHAGRGVSGAAVRVLDLLRALTSPVAPLLADDTGRLTYRSIVPSGQADSVYGFTFQASKPGYTQSSSVFRQVQVVHPRAPGSVAGAPTFRAQPADRIVTVGSGAGFFPLVVGAEPFSYQWRFNGNNLPGETGSALEIPRVDASHAGFYSVVVSNAFGSVVSLDAPLRVYPASQLSNLSVRTTLGAGQNVIVGFVLLAGTNDLLIRAAGPSLASFGLSNPMADPRIEIFNGTVKVGENNDWPASLAQLSTIVGAFPFTVASRDAALFQPLGGANTVQVTGTGGGTVLVEAYAAPGNIEPRLINLSARNRVGTGADILIAGFSITGVGTKRVLIRAVGPTLSALGVTGVLADPQLEVIDSANARLATNDNWDASLAPVFAQVGAFALPVDSKDAAVVVTLNAGRSYTVQVSGVAATVGEALVEVYEVP